MTLSHYADQTAYQTKDGSEIRELMHPSVHGNQAQSLAEARLPAGCQTLAHRHRRSEELYHVTHGHGWLYRDGQRHWLDNPGPDALVLLCCCAPAYAHDDTELVGVPATGADDV